jgi:hypothetical protein
MPWSVANYDINPSLNVTINGIDIAELSAAAGYNDALRQIMADIKAWTNSYAVTYPISIANGGSGQANAAAALAAGALTITRGAAVALIWAATGADANRALAAGGMATILQVATDRWFISGAGLS